MLPVQHRDLVGMAAVGLLSALIAYFYYTGLYCSDDTRYLIGAIRIAIGEDISTSSLAERRVTLLLPAAAIYALTRSIDLSIAVYGLFFVGLGIVAYALARQFFGALAAAATALLAIAQPTLFLYSGALMPDIAAAFFLALALFFFCGWNEATETGVARRRSLALAAMGGASVAVGFALKESSLVLSLIPAALVALGIIRGRIAASIEAAVAMAAGFVGILLLEATLFRLSAGQWHSSIVSLMAPHDFSGYADIQGRTPLARLKSLYHLLGPSAAALFALAGAAVVQLSWQWSKRRLPTPRALAWLPVVGFWAWPTFYFTFGTASLSEYVLPVMQQRYYAPCVVPAALLAGRLIMSLTGALGRGRFLPGGKVVAFGVLIAFLVAPYAERRQRGLIYGAAAKEAFELAVSDANRRYPGVPIIDTDSGWTTDLNRCRLLLLSNSAEGRDRLLGAIRGRHDLKGRFEYADLGRLRPPFIVVGHAAPQSSPNPKPWAAKLKPWIGRHQLQVEEVGRYTAPSHRDLRGRLWLPRQEAVRALSKSQNANGSLLTFENATQDEGTLYSAVDVYLITSSEERAVD